MRPGHRIAEREVELPDQVQQHGRHVLAPDRHEGQRQAEVRGDALGLPLLHALRPEVEAEGADADLGLPEPDRDAGGVDPPRQVEADLGLAVQTPGDRLPPGLTDRADRGRPVAEGRVDRLAQGEVGRDGEPASVPLGEPAGQEAPHAGQGHVLAGDERERQVLVERDRVGLDRQAGDREELLQLAGEVEGAAVLDVVEGADAERVPDQGEPAPLAVPPRGGERAVQGVQALGPGPEAVREGGGRRGDRRREGAGAGDQVGTGAMDARRLPGPLAPPAVPEPDTRRDERRRSGRRGSRWRPAWPRPPPARRSPRSRRCRSRAAQSYRSSGGSRKTPPMPPLGRAGEARARSRKSYPALSFREAGDVALGEPGDAR